MQWIDEQNAQSYLQAQGWVGAREEIRAEPLAGGVSNQVLFIHRPSRPGDEFVLKQARPQLRTPEPWYSSVERIWREVEVLRLMRSLFSADPSGKVTRDEVILTPSILGEDRENYAFAMTAAPRDHRVWRALLLSGDADLAIARKCGDLLGSLHATTWNRPDLAPQLSDRKLFDELRLDPYYRFLARKFPQESADFERLIASVPEHLHAVVHADFSPKNLLVFQGGLMMVDFETGHFGDPAFDLGFFLTHLVLKATLHASRGEEFLSLVDAFWQGYAPRLADRVEGAEYASLVNRGMLHLAGCVRARLDGKSPVDYLQDETRREAARELSRWIFTHQPADWQAVRVWYRQRLAICADRTASPSQSQ